MTILVFVLLAKLAGENYLVGITEWVALGQAVLDEALHLRKPRAPHVSTYSRILGHVIDVHEFEHLVHDFFAALPGAGQSLTIAVDCKILR